MNVTDDIFSRLREPFPSSSIFWRVGRTSADKQQGQAVPCLDNRAIQDRLDKLIGPMNWSTSFADVVANGILIAVRCTLAFRIDNEWVGKTDVATFSDAHPREFALKGTYSDAMNRAAVQWGIGRYLYAYKTPWMPLDDRGRFTETPVLPDHMLPAGSNKAGVAVPTPPAPSTSAHLDTPATPNVGTVASEPVRTSSDTAPSTPTPPASRAATPQSDGMPSGLTEDQKALVTELLAKLGKIPPAMLKTYVEGPKAREKLPDAARVYLFAKIKEKEAALATAGA